MDYIQIIRVLDDTKVSTKITIIILVVALSEVLK